MDNTSKAVLIAGVMLIVLIVITIIVNLFNMFKNTNIDLSKRVDTSKVQYHNSQFNIYGKDNIEYSEVEKVIRIVNNSNNAQTGFEVKIYLKGKEIKDIDDFENINIDKSTIFKIQTDVAENGAIDIINISY